MKIVLTQALFAVVMIFSSCLSQAAHSADRFASLCHDAPVIVRAKILKLEPGTAISDSSLEFRIEAEAFEVAKGDVNARERIEIVIKLPVRDSALLRDTPFGMSEGADFILFLRPRFATDGKTFGHYRFTEIPLGCLPHDFYTWKQIQGAIEEQIATP